MSDNSLFRPQDLEMAIANAQQNLSLMRSQLKAGRIDARFFNERLQALGEILDQFKADQQNTAYQKRVAALYEVSKVIGSSLNLQTVLDQVMDAIIQLTGAERGFLMLLNDDAQLAVRVARNFDQETLQPTDVNFSRTITRQVFDTGKPVVTTNAQEDPRYAGQASIVAHSMRSVMATPLRARGTTIGVVYVDNRIREALFSDDDLAFFDAFASQAAVAIENARLYSATDAELQERLEELRILQWIDRQLNESLDVRKAMNLTLEWASRLCKADSGSIGLLDLDEGVVRLMSNYGAQNEFTETPSLPITHPLIRQVIKTEQAALQLSRPTDPHPKTILCVPIKLEGKTTGIVIFSANRADAFDKNAQALISRMADRAAIAIENARLYDAVRAADRAKSEFVSVVAHELKVPMTSITGYASLMSVVGSLNEKQSEFVRIIQNNVERMKILVSDLSDISRIESGHLNLNIEAIALQKSIEQANDGVMAQMKERNHEFVTEIAPDLPMVYGDPARVVQILVNLLSNAYKYTPNGGKIILRVAPDTTSTWVNISVQDSGIGMTDEQIKKLGTKFYRVDNDHVNHQPGTGLGFAIVRNLIELMNGNLMIESTVGKGSTFVFGLPVATIS